MELKHTIAIVLVVTLSAVIIANVQITFYDSVDTPLFLQNTEYAVVCDERFLEPPTNCRIENEQGDLITEDIVNDHFSDACWWLFDDDHPNDKYTGYFPCRIDSGPFE